MTGYPPKLLINVPPGRQVASDSPDCNEAENA